MPFIPVYVKNNLRLSATAFATILTFQQFLNVVTTPVIGYVTDYFNRIKTIIYALAVVQSGFLFIMFTLPAIPKGQLGSWDHIQNTTLFNSSDSCEKCVDISSQYNSINTTEEEKSTMENNLLLVKFGDKLCFFSEHNDSSVSSKFQTIIPDTCHFFPNKTLSNQSAFSSSNVSDLHLAESSIRSNSSSSCAFTSEKSCAIFSVECNICCSNSSECYLTSNLHYNDYKGHTYHQSDFQTYQFWLFAFVYAVFHASTNAIFMLSHTACCEAIQKNEAEFGKQRLWGAVGWGIFAALGGFLNDYTMTYYAAGLIYAAIYVAALWNISTLDLDKPRFSKDILKNIGTVMRSKEFICLQVGIFMNGIGLGFIWFYLLWFLASIGGDGLVCGLVQTVHCFAGEIPFMFIAGWVLKKVGYFNVLSLSLLAYCIRFFWYSRLENPWMVLPIEWTNGITYGLMHSSLATYAKLRATPGTESTTQSVVFATYEGLGSGIGNIIAGVSFDYFGGHQMFFYSSVMYGFFTMISVVLTLLNRTKKVNSGKVNEMI